MEELPISASFIFFLLILVLCYNLWAHLWAKTRARLVLHKGLTYFVFHATPASNVHSWFELEWQQGSLIVSLKFHFGILPLSKRQQRCGKFCFSFLCLLAGQTQLLIPPSSLGCQVCPPVAVAGCGDSVSLSLSVSSHNLPLRTVGSLLNRILELLKQMPST